VNVEWYGSTPQNGFLQETAAIDYHF